MTKHGDINYCPKHTPQKHVHRFTASYFCVYVIILVRKRSHTDQETGTMLKQLLLKLKQTNVQEVCLSVKQRRISKSEKNKQTRDNKVDSKSKSSTRTLQKIKIYTLKMAFKREIKFYTGTQHIKI